MDRQHQRTGEHRVRLPAVISVASALDSLLRKQLLASRFKAGARELLNSIATPKASPKCFRRLTDVEFLVAAIRVRGTFLTPAVVVRGHLVGIRPEMIGEH